MYDFLIFLLLLLLSAFNSKKFLFTRRDRTTDSPINNDLRTLSTSKIILFKLFYSSHLGSAPTASDYIPYGDANGDEYYDEYGSEWQEEGWYQDEYGEWHQARDL